MKKSDSEQTVDEKFLSQSSLLSTSTSQQSGDPSPEKSSADEPPPAQPSNKSKYRLASSFNLKSFGSKKSKKSKSDLSIKTVQSDEDANLGTDGTIEKRKKRGSLVKRFSLNYKKHKKASSDKSSAAESGSSTTTTPKSLKRHTPEGGNLSLSNVSLFNIEADEKQLAATAVAVLEEEKKKAMLKGEHLQILITGKKIETRHDDGGIELQKERGDEAATETTTATKSNSEYLNVILKITESGKDSMPLADAPAVPYNISDVEISNILSATGDDGSGGGSSEQPKSTTIQSASGTMSASTGAIKKTVSSMRRDFFDATQSTVPLIKSSSLERGRRYPRPVEHNVPTGNNLENTNLSGSITTLPDESEQENELNIKFEVGTKVRSPSSNLTSSTEPLDASMGRDDSLDTLSKSSESSEPKSDSSASRRRIAYVAAQTNSLSEDDPAALVDFQSKEPLSHLSGISEYSIDSELSLVPYSDLIMDDVVCFKHS